MKPAADGDPAAALGHYLEAELYQLVRKDGAVFDFLQDGSLDGIWYWDLERPEEEWMSPRLKQVFGYRDHEIPNTSAWWQANIFPEDLAVALENFEKHSADPRHPYDQIVRYRHKDGSTIWVRCRGIAIRDARGKPIRLLGAHTDVTELKRAEERFRALLEASADIQFTLDLDSGEVVAHNATLAQRTGLGSQLKGSTLASLCHPSTRGEAEAALAVLRSGEPLRAELSLRRRDDGTPIPILLTGVRGSEPGGARRARCWCREIGHLRRLANLEVIFESLPEATLLVDGDGRIALASGVAEALLGSRREQLIDQPVERFLPGVRASLPDTAGEAADPLRPPAAGGDLVTHHPDGRELALQVRLGPQQTLEGAFSLVVIADLTQRRAMGRALEDSEQRLRALVEASAQIVWTADADGQATEGWQAWQAFTGQPPGEQRESGWLSVIHPEDRERTHLLLRQGVESARTFSLEYRVRHVSGSWRWMTTRSVPLTGSDGSLRGWIGSSVDITERRRAEALSAGQKRVLEMIAEGAALETTLDALLRTLEAHSEDMQCSILLLDADGRHLRHVAAPSLPEAYLRAIDGGAIGPAAGSCGTAAFRAEPVIVADIATDPLWVDYRDLALPHGLRACWSTPILDEHKQVLGSFAIYYRSVALPEPRHREVIDIATHTAAICIGRHKRLEALRDSERRFRQMAESLPQHLWTCQPDGRCDFLSSQWTRYTGVPAAEYLGAGWLEQVHAEDRTRLEQSWRLAVATGADFKAEHRLRREDGAYRWFDTHGTALRDDAGRVVKWFGANTDVHEARQLRESLQEEKERLASIVATAPGAYCSFRLRPDGSLTCPDASPGIEGIYGIPPERLAEDAEPALERVHPDDVEEVRASLAESARSLGPWRCECRVGHPRKGELWVEGHLMPVREADGSVLWHGFLRDVTERRRSELEARRQVILLDLAPVLIRDAENRITHWGAGVEELFGFSREEAVGRVAHELLRTEFPVPVHEIEEALDRTGAWEGELVSVRRDGDPIAVASRWVVHRDARGKPAGVVEASTDITERKRSEESRFRTQKLEALGTLAGGIAHDFNNVLGAIAGNTRLAIDELPADHPAQARLKQIATASTRATDLVRRIVGFSRPQDEKRVVVGLEPVLEEALSLLRATLPAQIEIRVEAAADAPLIACDPSQIHQVLVNLVANAAHAIGTGRGRIGVAVDGVELDADAATGLGVAAGCYARLTVSDDGCGMDRETQRRVFDPFFTTKPTGEGTGLGLSVVHGIVSSHGGAIAIESAPRRGTEFRSFFPAAEPDQTTQVSADEGELSGATARVLYVDDEEPLVELAELLLSRLGHEVTGFSKPELALEAFRAQPEAFDVVVTDLSMPGLSGFELARAVLALRPEIPVLMTTGFISVADQEAAAATGIHTLILKPGTVDELHSVLDKVLRAARES